MALADNPSMVRTPGGSEIAVYRTGVSGKRIFVVGGFGGHSIAESPLGALIEAAGRFGARGTIVDISGTGKSVYRGELTMELWLHDVEHVYLHEGDGPAIWIGSSIGAWLMLLLQRRHPSWFLAMCALAPAWDWDTQYLRPALERGELQYKGEDVMVGVAPLSPALVSSMANHHVLGCGAIPAMSPLHVIHGERDAEAPFAASLELVGQLGAGATLEPLPGDDHGVSRLATVAARNGVERWLYGQVTK